MMARPIAIPGYKVAADGKVEKDHRAAEAKLDVSARIARRKSQKVRVVVKGGGNG
jgi:hypothetical protein